MSTSTTCAADKLFSPAVNSGTSSAPSSTSVANVSFTGDTGASTGSSSAAASTELKSMVIDRALSTALVSASTPPVAYTDAKGVRTVPIPGVESVDAGSETMLPPPC